MMQIVHLLAGMASKGNLDAWFVFHVAHNVTIAEAARVAGGSDVAFEIPGLGAFSGRNITPDKETGIGDWTSEQIVTALQIGKRPDGSTLAPIMPWHAFANLSKDDVMAIAAFLKSVPPVRHEVAGPFRPGDKVTTFLYRILPPGETAATAK